MRAAELKEKLDVEKIRELLILLNCEFYFEDEDLWITDTICHQGNKPKLYFYKDTMTFHCYTECGQMDVINLIMHIKGYGKDELHKAINFICIKLNLDNCEYGFGKQEQISDWDFINKYKRISHKNGFELKGLESYDEKVLRIFNKLYPHEWLEDGISEESMDKYNISYCMWQQRIIIPHYDIENRLIGIRGRALLDEDIEIYGKYQPFRVGKRFYNHPLGMNLFGLNRNIKAIQKKGKIMLVEAEKSVLQTDTMFGDDNFTVALCGNNFSAYQKGIILMLGVKEVIIALDKQYQDLDSEECKKWAKHIKENIITPLAPYVRISVLWDTSGLLEYKDSPTDKGKEVLLKLMENKIYVGCN